MDPVYVFLPYIEFFKSMARSFSLDALTLLVPDLRAAYAQEPLHHPVDGFSQVPSTVCAYTEFLFSPCGSMLVNKVVSYIRIFSLSLYSVTIIF